MAERIVVVFIPGLAETHTARIREEAEQCGFKAVFPENREEAKRSAESAEVLFTYFRGLCRHAPGLKWICTPFAGVEPFLETGIIENPEVLLTSSSGAYGVTIAEHVVMVTLEMMRRRTEYIGIVRRKEWTRDLHIDAIRGSRITLLGTGDIGRECAKRLRAFEPASMTGVNLRGGNPDGLFDRIVKTERLEEVLPETDLLILSLPSTPETRGILNVRRLAMLPDGARLVNVGRGSAVDQKALEKLLREGKLAGAALDVFEEEPLPAGDSLWDCPGLLITPHIAGNMTLDYTVERIVGQFLENLRNYAAGLPLRHIVDRKRAY